MTITQKELDLDKAAEVAMDNHRKFRHKFSDYFYATNRIDQKTGRLVPPPVNRELDRESSRLHGIAINANKVAADAEYEANRKSK